MKFNLATHTGLYVIPVPPQVLFDSAVSIFKALMQRHVTPSQA